MQVAKDKSHRVLFLCTGNYYRSRFAEEIFNDLARRAGLDWVACSRGLALERLIFATGPISPYALAALRDRGLCPPEPIRSPCALCLKDLEAADRIIALKEAEHRPLLEERFDGWEDRVEYWNVHDLDGSAPHEAMSELATRVAALVRALTPAS